MIISQLQLHQILKMSLIYILIMLILGPNQPHIQIWLLFWGIKWLGCKAKSYLHVVTKLRRVKLLSPTRLHSAVLSTRQNFTFMFTPYLKFGLHSGHLVTSTKIQCTHVPCLTKPINTPSPFYNTARALWLACSLSKDSFQMSKFEKLA